MQYDELRIENTASSMSLIFKCADAAVNKYAPCLKCVTDDYKNVCQQCYFFKLGAKQAIPIKTAI